MLWVLGSLLAGGACSYERDEGLHGPVPVILGASQAGSAGSGGKSGGAAGKTGTAGRSSGGAAASAGSDASTGASRATGGREGAAGAGAGSSSSPGGCQPGTARCDAVDPVLRTCDDSGSWHVETCPFVCRAGACAGDCDPGERRCDGMQPMRCNDLGAWITDGQTCDVTCLDSPKDHFLPNVKDEPRPSPARLVQHHDLDSSVSSRSIVR